MTTTKTVDRQPTKLDYASPVQFRFKCTKLPLIEFFCQSANIPGIILGEQTQATGLVDIPHPGDKITYADLDISFLVDENLNNWKELHDWMTGLGFPEKHQQFTDLLAAGHDRFPTSKVGTATPSKDSGSSYITAPLDAGATYSDATLTVLSSKNIAKTEIRFKDIFPTSIGSLSYNVKATDVDYLAVNASFKYTLYKIVQISTV